MHCDEGRRNGQRRADEGAGGADAQVAVSARELFEPYRKTDGAHWLSPERSLVDPAAISRADAMAHGLIFLTGPTISIKVTPIFKNKKDLPTAGPPDNANVFVMNYHSMGCDGFIDLSSLGVVVSPMKPISDALVNVEFENLSGWG
jgi:hypothetical protein